ncbi:MAG: hypothetical protein U0232_26530 [Thermomicrobiales bacterium]
MSPWRRRGGTGSALLAERRAAIVAEEERRYLDYSAVEIGLLIAATLAPDDEVGFRAIFAVASRAEYGRGGDTVKRGIASLATLPGVREALAATFARQHGRCLALLLRLGRATQFGAGRSRRSQRRMGGGR